MNREPPFTLRVTSMIYKMMEGIRARHLNGSRFCVPVFAIYCEVIQVQFLGLHPPQCPGATSDLQRSMTGPYQGFGAGLCRVI